MEVVSISRSRQNHCVKPQYQKHVLHDMAPMQRDNRPPTRGMTYRSTHTGMISPKSFRPPHLMASRFEVNHDWVKMQNSLVHHPFPNTFRSPPARASYAS